MLLMALGSGAVEKGRQAFRGPVRPWGKLRVHEEPHFALGTRSYFREPVLLLPRSERCFYTGGLARPLQYLRRGHGLDLPAQVRALAAFPSQLRHV